jgi:chromosome condensin MukBEF ATPase and DNA-binding subunit MukB
MNLFKAFKKLITHLTNKKDDVNYNEALIENEELITEVTIENPYVSQVRDWAVKKIELLHEADRHRNAEALAAEFDEWINVPEETEKLEYLCLEDEDWTDEQEIDVQ